MDEDNTDDMSDFFAASEDDPVVLTPKRETLKLFSKATGASRNEPTPTRSKPVSKATSQVQLLKTTKGNCFPHIFDL